MIVSVDRDVSISVRGKYPVVMARLRESYKRGEINELLEPMEPPTLDEVSIAADGRRLDTADAVKAFFDEMRAGRIPPPTGD